MAIMAMDMAQRHKWLICGLAIYTVTLRVNGGEWEFIPNLGLSETFTDNVELTNSNKASSLVSQLSAGIGSKYNSRLAEFTLNAKSTYASFSHDHDIDDDFHYLNANGRIALWTNGPEFTIAANIDNVARNNAENSLADIVSGDTVEYRRYQTGLAYTVDNSRFSIDSSINYHINDAEDSIGESEGFSASVKSMSENASRGVLWMVNGHFAERKNGNLSGETYAIESLLGFYTGLSFTPLIRFYDEDSTGNISGSTNTSMSSWGPGLRWKVSSQFYVDLSYNYAKDDKLSDDYLAAAINWQPSERTSLTAKYDQRFYGDSYDFKFEHKLKRLSNSISYNETINAFERDSYQQVLLGNYWCPIEAGIDDGISQCFLSPNSNIEFDQYQLISLFDQELIEGNEFSLNKTLSWQTQLSLARTTFSLTISNRERESLTSGRRDDSFNAGISITRKISGKSDFTLSSNFRREEFDKTNPESDGQTDYYRTFVTTYSRKLARTLSASFTLQYLDRSSSLSMRTYEETRAILNLTKDF